MVLHHGYPEVHDLACPPRNRDLCNEREVEDMPLTPDQIERFQSWMEEKGVDKPCPACGRMEWVTEEVITVPVRARGGLVESAPQIPLVESTCDNCGFVRFFSAVKAGLLS